MENENFKYEVKLGLVYLTEYQGEDADILEIPKKIDGRIVYSIESFCFVGKTFKKVIIPSIYSLKEDAFVDCLISSLEIGSIEVIERFFKQDTVIEVYSTFKKTLQRLRELNIDMIVFYEKDYDYVEKEDGTLKILQYKGIDRKIIMPDEIKGKKVSEISSDVFRKDKKIFETLFYVKLPKYVNEIPSFCFYCAKNLKTIETDGVIETVGRKAFYGAPLKFADFLKDVIIVEEAAFALTHITELISDKLRFVGKKAFSSTCLERVVLRNENLNLEPECFSRNMGLKSIEISKKYCFIPEEFANECPNLKEVLIQNVVEVGVNAFNGDKNLKVSSFIDEDIIYYGSAFKGCFIDTIHITKNFKLCPFLFSEVKTKAIIFDDDFLEDTIPEYCFYKAEGFSKVVLPKSIKTIECCAFASSSLKEINIEDVDVLGEEALARTEIVEVSLGKNVENLLETFSVCVNLEKVNFPKDGKLKVIDLFAFASTKIKELDIPETVETIKQSAFRNTPLEKITINSNISFSDYLFANSLLKEVIWNTECQIPKAGFRGSRNLETIIFKKNITEISDEAFLNCTSLKNIDLPETIVKINSYAFYGSGLLSIKIPEKVTEIGECAFKNCLNLKKIVLDENLLRIEKEAFALTENLKEITIPESITSISIGTFYASGIETIKLPKELDFIGDKAFYANRALKEVILPENLGKLGLQNFRKTKDEEKTIFKSKNKKVFSKIASRTYAQGLKELYAFEKIK